MSDASDDDAATVLQLDLVVCCDSDRLVPQGIDGAPDLVIEVVSPDCLPDLQVDLRLVSFSH